MTKSKSEKLARTPAKPYEPTPEEAAVGVKYLERTADKPPSPRLNVEDRDGNAHVTLDHPDPEVGTFLITAALGITEPDFFDGLLSQLINIGSPSREIDEQGLNFMLAAIKGIEPRDQTETMLASQMAAIHLATMTMARRLNLAENLIQQDGAEKAFNKLARTFALQIEALRKYRNGGEQKVTVQHVNVSDGGQAIVGHVQGGGGSDG